MSSDLAESIKDMDIEYMERILSIERNEIERLKEKKLGLELLYIEKQIPTKSQVLKLDMIIRKKKNNISEIVKAIQSKHSSQKKERISSFDNTFVRIAKDKLNKDIFDEIVLLTHKELDLKGD